MDSVLAVEIALESGLAGAHYDSAQATSDVFQQAVVAARDGCQRCNARILAYK